MFALGYWYVFPISIAIATMAMMTGIGGALLFSPFFMLVLKLDPVSAMLLGLTIEIFGFSSGVIGYWRAQSIDFQLVKRLLPYTIPVTIIGVAVGSNVPGAVLKGLLACLLISLAYQFLFTGKQCEPKHPACTGESQVTGPVRIDVLAKSTIALGGLLLGMISSGLGEMNEYNFIKRFKMRVPLASGTSVLLVATSAFIGVTAHVVSILSRGAQSEAAGLLGILIFAVPGVIIGGQVGVAVAKRMDRKRMGVFVGVLFLAVGIVTAWSIIAGLR